MRARSIVGWVLLGMVGVVTGCANLPADEMADETEDDADESKASSTALGVGELPHGSDRSGSRAGTLAPPPVPAPATGTATATLTVSFTSSGKVDKNKRGRSCADGGSKRSKGALIDATEVHFVPVQSPGTVIAKVGPDGAGGSSIDALKRSVASTGQISFAVPLDAIPTTTTNFAIVGYGQDFGSPATCGRSIAMTSPDVEEFPRGCGVLGYFDARYVVATRSFVVEATSQLLWGSNPLQAEDSRFTAPSEGCDFYDSPLVLDLGGHGITLGAPVDGVFDIDGDGHADRLSWITSKETPFLVRDANLNGVVDGIDELFGNRTRGPLGTPIGSNGFAALAVWDADGNGSIDARDPVWSTLRLWFDDDHDGKTDAGELVSLESRGIRSLAVGYVDVEVPLSFGDHAVGAIRQRSAAQAAGGGSIPLLDVWFRRDL